MNIMNYLKNAAAGEKRRAMPVLSFPAVQKMNVTVRELTADSELQANAMKLVADNTPDSVASVSFMDLSVEAEAFGACVRFSDHEVPTITGQLVADEDAANALKVPSVGDGRTGVCVEGIRKAKKLITDRPVFAGCIGPYSLAGRLMDVTEIMYLCFDEPETVEIVLNKAVDFLIAYINAFKEAGADGVVMAEPLAGLLSPAMNAEFSCPYVEKIIKAVQTDDFAVIYHNCGNSVIRQLDDIFELNAAAYHFGNAVSMEEVFEKAPENVICMGNIDPASHFASGTPEGIYDATAKILRTLKNRRNFIVSSGCDIPPHAKWENINAFFKAVSDSNE